MFKYIMRVFELDVTIIYKPEEENDTYAISSDDGCEIIIYNCTHPRIFERTLIHELAHAVNSTLFVHIMSIVCHFVVNNPESIKELVDEHSAITSELAQLIYKNHKEEIETLLVEYTKFYNESHQLF